MQPNVLWRQTNRVCDLLTIAHQFGHVMHYNLSMDSQPFYRFMPINIVKETFGFFWEALGLAYLCAIADEQTQDMLQRSYSLRSYHQWEEALRLKKEQKAKPALFYPLARQLGEKLALQVLQQTLSKNDVMSLMQRGKNLSTEELIVVTNSVKYLKTTPYYV
ncbi:hypothetical protein CS022_09535 [Veronia nyctiphanis]|uniref:Peptidase M3A/M3B catalytic domain-containing protein n=1 Tax=Veronia nyctiphanis TaxID=1278244 RepID=A0A4Q0YQX4_9GAMM|nr:hypothetical protein [Veronia nyctiphanis]RXJ73476.1 hypothetical protein CS022_09535 [Veronia nyctiphanis]